MKGSEKVLGKGSGEGGLLWVLQYKKVLRRVLRRGSEKGGGFHKVPRTPPRRVRPLRRAPYWSW